MSRVLCVEGVSKRYSVHHIGRPLYGSLRESISEGALSLGKRFLGQAQRAGFDEDFWALKDVSFELQRGERLGVIGRNGAGKSTLLKLLSRITEPTEGRIEIRGKVSSLLEVGTGFHPELTGRENIFLNGTILGMSSSYIRRKFDEIVAFAEIEQFLDTPVKRYSSGMYVRLAFSVAAHLEPDILIVDEVLSVGDAQFQRKCLGKMEDTNRDGRTIIFVSHNMTAISSLCSRCLLLEHGSIKAIGETATVTAEYFKGGFEGKGASLMLPETAPEAGDGIAKMRWARLVDEQGGPVDLAYRAQRIGIQVCYEILVDGQQPIPNVHLHNQGQCVFVSLPHSCAAVAKGCYVATMWIPQNFLNEGVYVAGIAVSTLSPVRAHFNFPDALIFSVLDDITDPDRNNYVQSMPGVIRPRLDWSIEQAQDRNATSQMETG